MWKPSVFNKTELLWAKQGRVGGPLNLQGGSEMAQPRCGLSIFGPAPADQVIVAVRLGFELLTVLGIPSSTFISGPLSLFQEALLHKVTGSLAHKMITANLSLIVNVKSFHTV